MATAKKPAVTAEKKPKAAPWEGKLDGSLAAAKKAPKPKAIPAVEKPPAKPKAAGKVAFQKPKNAATAADRCYTLREERLGLTRQADGLKAEEGFLREYLIETLPSSDATGVAGKLVRATVKSAVIPQAKDWGKIYDFIVDWYLREKKKKSGLEHGAFAILNKALNAASVTELWDAKIAVPGVEKFNAKTVSFNKIA